MIKDNRLFLQETKFDSWTGNFIDGKYEIREKLWQDELCVVYEALDMSDETEVHVRLYSKYANLDPINKEVLISQQVSHPTIPDFKAWNLDKEKFGYANYVVTEPVYLKPLVSGQQFSEKMIKLFFEQILDGVETLHQASFYGLSLDQSSFALNKLSAFDEGVYLIKFIGQEKGYIQNHKTADGRRKAEYEDIFALGGLLFMMITGGKPFHSNEPHDSLYNLVTTDIENFIQSHPIFDQILKTNRISENLINLVIDLLQGTEETYPSIEDIRMNIWMETTEIPNKGFIKPLLEII